MFERKSGIILHPTSLPGPYGIGEIGSEAAKFAGLLAEMGQSLWQVLPLGPTGFGDSPYQSTSAFAGNTAIVDLDDLARDGLLENEALAHFPKTGADRVDYRTVLPVRAEILGRVCRSFTSRASEELLREWKTFCQENGFWLEDYALFSVLKEHHQGRAWTEWARELSQRESAALEAARQRFSREIEAVTIAQYLFFRQWRRLRSICHGYGVEIIGDLPIFAAHDSADVWAHPEWFYLDEDGNPTIVAGVPPDYFSETGQRWGNPLYRWDVMARDGYSWWRQRFHKILEIVDIVRIDHFRGFEAYWEIPAKEETAVNGKWTPGPGRAFFDTIAEKMGPLPVIAEDLGHITDEVRALLAHTGFPGMKVLQFALNKEDMAKENGRPDAYPKNSVCYTGTHDNDTALAWYRSLSTEKGEEAREHADFVQTILKAKGEQANWALTRLCLETPCHTALLPLQDVLGLDRDARMNVPGTIGGNWCWRFTFDQLSPEIKKRLQNLTRAANRLPSTR